MKVRIFAAALLLAAVAMAQTASKKSAPAPSTSASTASAKAVTLRPPKGSKVAIVIFEDLQCPDCRNAHPLLMEAKKAYTIPVVVYDFPLPIHNWSYKAALYARYFRTVSAKVEADFREYIFQNQ